MKKVTIIGRIWNTKVTIIRRIWNTIEDLRTKNERALLRNEDP